MLALVALKKKKTLISYPASTASGGVSLCRRREEKPLLSWYLMDHVRHKIETDDSDGNENVKKAISLITKTTTLHAQHAFVYISLPFLHDYDVKMPKFAFYGE